MNALYYVDANVFITAWYRSYGGYPIHIFPSLWEQMAEHRTKIFLLDFIYNEIEPGPLADKEKYSLRTWLSDHSFCFDTDILTNDFEFTDRGSDFLIIKSMGDKLNKLSLEMERKYEINEPSKGAGKNDIRLIVYAKEMKQTVVTLEATQNQNPEKKTNYKIPLICQEERVPCINFIEMIAELGIRV